MQIDVVTIKIAVMAVLNWVSDLISVFTAPPAIYFVAVALVGAVAGIARKFVPMRKR
ncbi:hypothetical protein [Solibacillus sp. NPDC093137]|uniref:hypothetical protein n=1 Tax=Solibacillus sp. NPDC093137 TaxID=3390678 RepID=UPI003D039171